MRRCVTHVVMSCLLLLGSVASAGPREDATLLNATQVITELRTAPDQNVPNWLLERAYAVAVVPNVIKVALIGGVRRGSGVMVLRRDDGGWSNPVFINVTGGNLGLQWGVQSTDLVLVFTSKASVEGLVGGKVTLGADASVATGPVGRQAAAATDVGLSAQIYSYSRNKGVFIGISLDGSAVTVDGTANATYYGKPGILASEITSTNATFAPQSSSNFISALGGVATASPAPVTPTGLPTAVTPGSSTTAPVATPTSPPSGDTTNGLVTYPVEDQHPGAEPPP